jgi:uncharacterized membrane protein
MFQLTQKKWRRVGAVCIAACAFMAWFGADDLRTINQSWWYMAGYWGLCLLFLVAALYVVLLDIRYIRMLYAIERREVFLQTLGSKEFREEILKDKNGEDEEKTGE